MGFIKQVRTYFFRKTAPINLEGKKINFQNSQRPDQNAFEELMASSLFFKEPEDRAKTNVGDSIENEVGTVAITSDVKAKANTSGFEDDRTLVTHAGQLPTVEADVAQDITGDIPFNGSPVEVTVDPSVDTRNNYLVGLATDFWDWLQSLVDQVNTNTTAIANLPSVGTTEWTTLILTDANVILKQITGFAEPTFTQSVVSTVTSNGLNSMFYYTQDKVLYIDYHLFGGLVIDIADIIPDTRVYRYYIIIPESIPFIQRARGIGYGRGSVAEGYINTTGDTTIIDGQHVIDIGLDCLIPGSSNLSSSISHEGIFTIRTA